MSPIAERRAECARVTVLLGVLATAERARVGAIPPSTLVSEPGEGGSEAQSRTIADDRPRGQEAAAEVAVVEPFRFASAVPCGRHEPVAIVRAQARDFVE